MFLNKSDYPFTNLLEAAYSTIKAEFEAIPKDKFMPWHEKHLYTNDWRVFALVAFRKKMSDNCRLCPETMKILEKVPNLVTAGFSKLLPGTHILPHKGYSKSVLRCHLGIAVPEACALTVNGQTRAWAEGECLVFDDTCTHEAWNKSKQDRTVLLLDFKKDSKDFSLPEKVKNSLIGYLASRGKIPDNIR